MIHSIITDYWQLIKKYHDMERDDIPDFTNELLSRDKAYKDNSPLWLFDQSIGSAVDKLLLGKVKR